MVAEEISEVEWQMWVDHLSRASRQLLGTASRQLANRQRRSDGQFPREAQDVRVAKPDTAM